MTPEGYNRIQIALHWGIAVLIAAAFLTHDGMEDAWRAVERGTAEPGSFQLHSLFGLMVLVLMLARLGVRLVRGAPPPPRTQPLLDRIGVWSHWALYAVFILLPAAGAAAWIGGIRPAAELHEMVFNIAFLLVGLHTVAALFHHYVLRDGLIRRMIRPG